MTKINANVNTTLLILSLVPAIIEAIHAVENAIPMSGQGKIKADLVLGILESGGEIAKEVIPAIMKTITSIVTALNLAGIFKKGI